MPLSRRRPSIKVVLKDGDCLKKDKEQMRDVSYTGEGDMGTYQTNGPPWVGVLLFGIVMTFGGVMFIAFSASMQSDQSLFYDRDFSRLPMTMGGIALAFGLIIIAVAVLMFVTKTGEPQQPPQTPQPAPQSVEKHVVEEVIKIRCRYCGTLNNVNDKSCTACGGVL
jgi:hypothetical protein